MNRSISATEASRRFSEILRRVREGHSYVVTSHDQPIAKIVPVGHTESVSTKARSSLLKRLRSQKIVAIGRWRRDDLYECPNRKIGRL